MPSQLPEVYREEVDRYQSQLAEKDKVIEQQRQEIRGYVEEIDRLEKVKITLEDRVGRILAEKETLAEQVRSMQAGYEGRIATLTKSLQEAEGRLDELSKGVTPPEILFEEYLSNPEKLLELCLSYI